MKKNRFIPGILFTILGLLIAIGPHTLFSVCEAMEGKFMKCHWTAQAESGIGAAIVLAGFLSFFFVKEELRIGIYLATSIQAIVVILIPSTLIGVCGGEHMRCHALTLPALNILGVITLIVGLGYSVYLLLSAKENDRKEKFLNER